MSAPSEGVLSRSVCRTEASRSLWSHTLSGNSCNESGLQVSVFKASPFLWGTTWPTAWTNKPIVLTSFPEDSMTTRSWVTFWHHVIWNIWKRKKKIKKKNQPCKLQSRMQSVSLITGVLWSVFSLYLLSAILMMFFFLGNEQGLALSLANLLHQSMTDVQGWKEHY